VLDSVKLGFDNDVAQIKVVNPEVDLVTKGTGMLMTVVNGELVIPTKHQSNDVDGNDPDNVEEGHDGKNA
jgi:hypothetical protein